MEKKVTANRYYETILNWFKHQIVAGELVVGDLIPSERELAAQFGVSRVPVREALRILEFVGIISTTSDGMVVQKTELQLLEPKSDFALEITVNTLENLFEVRMFLESSAAFCAAQRRTAEDIEKMKQSIAVMMEILDSNGEDHEQLIAASHQFHFCVISAAKNPVLEQLYRSLYDLLEVSKQYTMNDHEVTEATVMDHEAILYKIEQGKADEASKYMKFHLNRALKKLNKSATEEDRDRL